MARLAIFNCKGGVGKTTTALNLAAALARAGESVCLADMDPQAHLTRIFDKLPDSPDASLFALYAHATPLRALLQELPGLGQLLPAHGQLMKVDSLFGKGPSTLNRLRIGLETLESDYAGHVLIDCCPYVGVLSLSAVFAASSVLIPVSSDYLSLQGAKQIDHALNALEPVLKRRMPRRYLITRFDRRRRMGEDIRRRLREEVGDDLCETVISENVAVAMSPSLGKDVFAYKSDSRGAQDYQALLDELRAANLI
ncbi:MAG: ParA family protein [Hydrogenophilales bacterium]|nr:ParA family protein [Hydrogenophilales bacterium]